MSWRSPRKHIEVGLTFLSDCVLVYLLVLSVNLLDLRKGLGELRDGLKSIRKELEDNFSDPLEDDRYGTQMWSFVAKAGRQLEDLVDDVNNAETTFNEAVNYYGEEDKNMSSSEFYGIFKTFVTSYKVRMHHLCLLFTCMADDRRRNVEVIIRLLRKRNWLWRNASRRWRRLRPGGGKRMRLPRLKVPFSMPCSRNSVMETLFDVGTSNDRRINRLPLSMHPPVLETRQLLWRWIC
jgi:hypothetical protein